MAKLVPQDHPALHQIAEEVPIADISTPKIQKVLKDMKAVLRSYSVEGFSGIAIAAPQIGVPLRIFLVHDMSEKEYREANGETRLPSLIAINPKIIKISKKKNVVGEGCLSVPNDYGAVERAHQVTIRAYNEKGEEYERGSSGLLAQIFQHEIDHLDGILFIDRAEKIWDKDHIQARQIREARNEQK